LPSRIFSLLHQPQKNASYLKEILALLYTCLLKFIPMIPPESIGKYYTTPKMIREIALVVAFEK